MTKRLGSAMRDLATGLALVLVVEGVTWAVAPAAMKRAAERIVRVEDGALRLAGLLAAAVGVFAVWLIRG